MKIAFIINSFPLLSETFILNQITGLIDRGHDVEIHARHVAQQNKVHPDVARYKLLDRVHLLPDPSGTVSHLVCLVQALLARPVWTLGALRTALSNCRGFRQAIRAVCRARRLANNHDILLCHFGPNGALAASLSSAGLITGKVVTVFHGYDMTTYIREHGQQVYDELFDAGDLFLPISERWKQQLLAMGCPQEKVRVHHMGVDIERFEYRPRGDGHDAVSILSVCRLVEKKGIEFAIRAIAANAGQGKALSCDYTIVGDGPLHGRLESLIAEAGLQDRVTLTGWKTQDEVGALMDAADIFLVPSVTSTDGDQEGIPVVLMEAMAKGLVVCATDHSGIPELVEDAVNGYLVPERDAAALADKLACMVTNQGDWSEISAQARKKIQADFNIEVLNAELEALFRELSG